MTPSERTMPTLTATWNPRLAAYEVPLPGGSVRLADDEAKVRQILAREVPGTAVRFVRDKR